MEDYYSYCPDCKKHTEVVHDHSAGDAICLDCGLVLEARSIDETKEWRNFYDDTTDNDPVRVGSASNPLLDGGGLETVISRTADRGSNGDLSSITRLQYEAFKSSDRSLVAGFGNIAEMAER